MPTMKCFQKPFERAVHFSHPPLPHLSGVGFTEHHILGKLARYRVLVITHGTFILSLQPDDIRKDICSSCTSLLKVASW